MEWALKDRPTKNSRRLLSPVPPRASINTSDPRLSNAESIADGLQFVFGAEQEGSWTASVSAGRNPSMWTTAYVLSRLGDVPASFFTPAQYQRMEESVAWLQQARTREGIWGFSSDAQADAESTAWVMVALRRFGQPVPHSVSDWLRSCRRSDGGFALHPPSCREDCCRASSPGVTAVAAKALGDVDSHIEQYLAMQLQNIALGDAAAIEGHIFVSSEILDCESALAPWSLLNGVCRLATLCAPKTGVANALLLRSLLRLRMRRALHVADVVRGLQQRDGSWPHDRLPSGAMASVNHGDDSPTTDSRGLLATVTAISALGIAQSQPGMYDGSYLPRPKRMPEV
jgi:hypothetical protein